MSRSSRKKVAETKPTLDCVVCKDQLGESHQLVFDEVGVELELQKLLSQCFGIEIVQDVNEVQAVCDNCLNDLVETVDIQEKEVEERAAVERSIEGPSSKASDHDTPEDGEGGTSGCAALADAAETEVYESMEFKTEVLEDISQGSDFDDQPDYDVDFDKSFENALVGSSKFLEDDQTESSQLELDDEYESYENVDYLEDDTETFDFKQEKEENFDLKEYKLKCLNSKFDDIVFPTDIICQHCIQSFTKHVELVEHIANEHCSENGTYICGLNDSCEPKETLSDMAYHLVFQHYDLNKLSLYTQCPTCWKRFSNVPSFNKHSCYDTKSVSRTTMQCDECGDIFQSNKRYRFHLQFHLNEHRPKGCLICDTMFSNETELYEHLFYKHEEDIGFTCIRCDVTFTNKENLNNHKKVHKVVRPFKCQICPKSYLYNQQLKDHVIAHHSKRRSFQCPICGKQLYKQTLLNKHVMLHEKPEEKQVLCCTVCGLVGDTEEETEDHIKKVHKEGSMAMISIDVAYCCEFCEMAFQSPDTLRAHRKMHTRDEFFCNMCPAVYDEYKKLKTHKLTHVDYVDKRQTFPVMRHYLCDVPECTQSYMQWTTLRSHKRNKHLNKSVFTCPKCSEEFRNPIRFNQHMQNVHGGAIHSCPFCEKTYSSKMAISVHVARKHNTPKIQCNQCSSLFANESYLERHIAYVHCSVQCPFCDKILKNLKNLHVHQRTVHDKEKRYFCSYCNKGYYNQCDRIEHEESVHKKVKRFKCELCDYQAIYKQTLTIHMRAHNNESPYKCTICPKAFRRAYGLSLHMRRHYNIRNYVCPYDECGAAYPNQGILNSHLRKKHPNGETVKSRKRKTIAISEQSGEQEVKKVKKSRRRFDVPYTDVFIDDDDGLDDGVIGEPQSVQAPIPDGNEVADEEDVDDPDVPVGYIFNTKGVPNQAVIVQRNESDHDYIIKPEDSKIYGNVIEEYEVIATDVVLEE